MAASGVYLTARRVFMAEVVAGVYGDGTTVDIAKTGAVVTYFAIGEGGYTTVGPTKVPVTPLANRLDTEATLGPSSPSDSATGLRFQKNFGIADVSEDGAGIMTAVVRLDPIEPGLDNNSKLTGNVGGDPQLFEVCLFDENDRPIAYCTFDEIVKIPGRTVEIPVRISY